MKGRRRRIEGKEEEDLREEEEDLREGGEGERRTTRGGECSSNFWTWV